MIDFIEDEEKVNLVLDSEVSHYSPIDNGVINLLEDRELTFESSSERVNVSERLI